MVDNKKKVSSAGKQTGHHVKKHLAKILSLQLFFALLFGSLGFIFFYLVGPKIAVVISFIIPIGSLTSHELTAITLAVIGFVIASFLAVYTVGQHYYLKKQFSTILIGTIATSTLAIILLWILKQSFLVPILIMSLLVALFGYHSNEVIPKK